MEGQQQPPTSQHQLISQMSSEMESLELSSELDDALNELGMLSTSSGTGVEGVGGIISKKELKDKLRRVSRYPLRREKEREISWSSASSSGSCCGSSSGYSSRRSSSSSVASCSSFTRPGSGLGLALNNNNPHHRSPLIASYSIAIDTPTGTVPSSFSSSSSISSSSSTTAQQPHAAAVTFQQKLFQKHAFSGVSSSSASSMSSSFGSHGDIHTTSGPTSFDLQYQQRLSRLSSSAFKSVDIPKVMRRINRSSYKPYVRRRYSLNIGKDSCGRRMGVCCPSCGSISGPSIGRRSSSSSFYSSPGTDTLILRSGLSDSEASSGSGTGTPPPSLLPLGGQTSRPHSSTTTSFNTSTTTTEVLLCSEVKETKSNPSSPEKEILMMSPTEASKVVTRGMGNGGYCSHPSCPFGPSPHVHSAHGVLTRSKSMDDLAPSAFFSEDSSSSVDVVVGGGVGGTCCAPMIRTGVAVTGPSCMTASGYGVFGGGDPTSFPFQQQQQQQIQPQSQQLLNTGIVDLSSSSSTSSYYHQIHQQLLNPSCNTRPLHHHSHHHLTSITDCQPVGGTGGEGRASSSTSVEHGRGGEREGSSSTVTPTYESVLTAGINRLDMRWFKGW